MKNPGRLLDTGPVAADADGSNSNDVAIDRQGSSEAGSIGKGVAGWGP